MRNRRLSGAKFHRQHPISWYIVDFYCHEHQLVVEVDGEIHLDEDVKAIRVVGSMPDWEPGMKYGEYADTEYRLPIRFNLVKGKDSASCFDWCF